MYSIPMYVLTQAKRPIELNIKDFNFRLHMVEKDHVLGLHVSKKVDSPSHKP